MNARRKFRLVTTPAAKPRLPGTWPRSLGTPVDPMANTYAARAHSVLHAMDVREPRGLSVREAIDVLTWANQPV